MSNKYLFMDIDGVLNTHPQNVFSSQEVGCHSISPILTRSMNKVIRETKCNIVISSAWKHLYHDGIFTLEAFRFLMKTHGLLGNNIVGFLDKDGSLDCKGVQATSRGQLIWKWINENINEEYYYAIVDDADDELYRHHSNKFVRTNCFYGITELDANKLIDILQ